MYMIKKFMAFSVVKKVIFVLMTIIIIFLLFIVFSNRNGNIQTITVKLGNFTNEVSVSGKVISSEDVALGFKNGGLVDKIYFKVGEKVKKGQAIASLDSVDAKGSLEIAKANYQKVLNGATSSDIDVIKAQVESAQVALDQVKIQQDVLVKNAKKNLLNSGFIPNTEDQLSNQVPPIISGTYLKEKEGQIIVDLYSSSGGASFKASGLIDAVGMASTEIPQPIADSGLFIKYINTGDRTKWVIDIPNKQSPNYLQNANAYETALSNQTQAIANATALLNQAKSALVLKQTGSRPEDVSAAYGSLLIAEGAYNDKFIKAPFDGIITKMDARVGEITSPNISLITMMGIDTFQIESYVPEVNIAKIKLGFDATVTLDAYGSEVFFNAKVLEIDPSETIRNGVSTYKIKLQFNDKDDRVKSGMTANASISTFNKPNVIVLPGGVIFEKGGKKFVKMKSYINIVNIPVVVGGESSLGQVEIVEGLKVGDQVILNPIVK